jgi:hypothetical protein
MNVKKLTPLNYSLVVDNNVWLWEKRNEAVSDAKLLGALSGVVCAAGTPAIKKRAVPMKVGDMLDDRRNGNALAPDAANQRVVHIDVDAKLGAHKLSLLG